MTMMRWRNARLERRGKRGIPMNMLSSAGKLMVISCALAAYIVTSKEAGLANALTCSLLSALAFTWQFSAAIVILCEVLRGRSHHPGATRPRAGGETRTHALLFTEQPPLPTGRLQPAYVPRKL